MIRYLRHLGISAGSYPQVLPAPCRSESLKKSLMELLVKITKS